MVNGSQMVDCKSSGVGSKLGAVCVRHEGLHWGHRGWRELGHNELEPKDLLIQRGPLGIGILLADARGQQSSLINGALGSLASSGASWADENPLAHHGFLGLVTGQKVINVFV